jgi:hypothetical protein
MLGKIRTLNSQICSLVLYQLSYDTIIWWNTLHQPSNMSQFGTSIHISMLIPILLVLISYFLSIHISMLIPILLVLLAIFCLSGIFLILETCQIILFFCKEPNKFIKQQ